MVKRTAMIFGVVFLLIGIFGSALHGGMQMGDPAAPSKLFGLFPVNAAHNVVHLLFGIWGLAASRSNGSALRFCQIGGIVYLALACLSVFAPTVFGLIPIGGNDIWLHAVLGVGLVGVGYTSPRDVPAVDVA